MVKFTIRTSVRVRVYPVNAFLPADGFLPSAPTVKKRVRTDASLRLDKPERVRAVTSESAPTHPGVRADISASEQMCPYVRTDISASAQT
jgi:hypothetical protein